MESISLLLSHLFDLFTRSSRIITRPISTRSFLGMASRPDEPLVELPPRQVQMPHAPDVEDIAAIEAAKEGLRSGKSINQIARKLGYERSTISMYIHMHPEEFAGLR